MARQPKKADLQNLIDNLLAVLHDSGVVDNFGTHDQAADDDAGAPTPRKRVPNGPRGEEQVHKLGRNLVCGTDERGYATPNDRAPTEIVLDASEGFIPLWRYGTTLRWCFDEVSLSAFEHPTQVKRDVRQLITEAVLAWGDSAPVKFKEERESYDFRIVVHANDNCNAFGCTLARAFFPDSGRHNLELYPQMFEQSEKEQVDTMIHEMGHIFGLRHFFANVSETRWPSVIFGTHRPFTIMNYGRHSELTQDDKDDLRRLYHAVWSGQLAEINGTPIRLFSSYHQAGTLVTPRFSPETAGK